MSPSTEAYPSLKRLLYNLAFKRHERPVELHHMVYVWQTIRRLCNGRNSTQDRNFRVTHMNCGRFQTHPPSDPDILCNLNLHVTASWQLGNETSVARQPLAFAKNQATVIRFKKRAKE